MCRNVAKERFKHIKASFEARRELMQDASTNCSRQCVMMVRKICWQEAKGSRQEPTEQRHRQKRKDGE